jgi:putative ABC transport system permease protein
LRDVSLDRPRGVAGRAIVGCALVSLGALGVVRTLVGGGATELVGVYAVLVFGGMVVLGPVIAPPFVQLVGKPLPAIGRISAQLARENASRNPRRTAATASALMVGIGLVTFIAVTADSIKASTVNAVDQAVQGDLIVTSDGAGVRALSPNLAAELRSLPEVEAVTTFRIGVSEVADDPQLLLAIDPATFPELIHLELAAGSIEDLGMRGIAVPATIADDNGWSIGQTIPVTFRDTEQRFLELVAVYDSVLPAPGDGYLISQELHTVVFPEVEQTDHTVYLELSGSTDAGDGRAAVETVADRYPSAQVRDISQFKQDRIDRINSFLLVLYALLALALLIAVIGIINTLLLSVYERTHELGLLRAVGMSRRQVAASICWESVLIAVLGACTGLVVGLFFGWSLVQALESEGARLFSVPGAQMVSLVGLAAVAGVFAALYPAWRAARLDVLRAIATE